MDCHIDDWRNIEIGAVIYQIMALLFAFIGACFWLKFIISSCQLKSALQFKIIYFIAVTLYIVWIVLATTGFVLGPLCQWHNNIHVILTFGVYTYILFTIICMWSLFLRLQQVFAGTILQLSKTGSNILKICIIICNIMSLSGYIVLGFSESAAFFFALSGYAGYVVISGTLVRIFIKKLKILNTNTTESTESDNDGLKKITLKLTILSIVQYIVTIGAILAFGVHMVFPVHGVTSKIWNTFYYGDIIVTMTCLYLHYNIGNNDYQRYCKYCIRFMGKPNNDTQTIKRPHSLNSTKINVASFSDIDS